MIGDSWSQFERLCDAVGNSRVLQYLDLRSNHLSPEHANGVSKIVTTNTALISLGQREIKTKLLKIFFRILSIIFDISVFIYTKSELIQVDAHV